MCGSSGCLVEFVRVFCLCSFLGISHFIFIILFFTPGIPVCGIAITISHCLAARIHDYYFLGDMDV